MPCQQTHHFHCIRGGTHVSACSLREKFLGMGSSVLHTYFEAHTWLLYAWEVQWTSSHFTVVNDQTDLHCAGTERFVPYACAARGQPAVLYTCS